VYLLKVSHHPANKRLAGACHDWRGCCIVVLSLACRGGEGRKCEGQFFSAMSWECVHLLRSNISKAPMRLSISAGGQLLRFDLAIMAAVYKRRGESAAGTFGHQIGPAAPDQDSAAQRGYIADQLRIAVQAVFAIFLPLGCIRQRQMRASPMSLPRFSREDTPVLSSVRLTPNLELNLLPRMSLPMRLLVEPLTLRLVRLLEALQEHSCRFIFFSKKEA
jgi:hypothetical protein